MSVDSSFSSSSPSSSVVGIYHRCAIQTGSGTMLQDDVNSLFCLVCTIASKLNCIPFDYNCRTQKLTVVNSSWRKLIWHASVFVLFLYARFLLVRLFQKLAYLHQREDAQFTISHVILLLFFLAFLTPTAFQINIWIKQDEIVHAFNQVVSASRKQRRMWSAPTNNGTFLDRIKIIVLPVLCYIGSMIMLCVFIVRPEEDQFLFSMLPQRYQTWWTFLVFLVVETFAAVSVATTIMFQHVIQVVMMKSCSDILLQNCAQTPIEIGEFSKMIQAYQVQHFIVTQFNRCYAWNIQVFKVVTVVIAVASNYMLIKSRRYLDLTSLVFVAVCGLVFPPLPVLLYDQAFRIHDYSQTFRSRMEVGLRALRYPSNRRYFVRKLKSLPFLNIRSGDFYMLNRTETLLYLYVITVYTTKLLIAL